MTNKKTLTVIKCKSISDSYSKVIVSVGVFYGCLIGPTVR